MTPKDAWAEIYRRFDPEEPADRTEWRADRPGDIAARVVDRLGLPFGTRRILLLGTVGTGKSTELLRVAEARAGDDFAVFLDLTRHFHDVMHDPGALDRVRSWEVLFLAGLAILRAARERLGHVWAPERIEALRRAFERLSGEASAGESPKIDVVDLASTMVVAASDLATGGTASALTILGKATKAASWTAKIGVRRSPLPDQDEQVQSMLQAVNALLAEIQHKYRGVLLVIDGLDRVRDPETLRALFIESSLLGQVACKTVVCGPIALRRNSLVPQVRGLEPYVLANLPVLDMADPTRHGDGVQFFSEVFHKRTGDLGIAGLAAPEQIDKLGYYSGGRARDFIKLVRMAVETAYSRDAASLTAEIVDDAVDQLRLLMEGGLNRAHVDLLAAVMDDPQHLLPDDEHVEVLLDSSCLLPYPNGSEWYYPHPLLTRRLVIE